MNASPFRKTSLALAAVLALLAACAQVPSLPEAARPMEIGRLGLDAPLAQRLDARWWQAYGDAELNALVERALQDAPAMALAQARLARARAATAGAEANDKPTIGLGAQLTRQRYSEHGMFPPPLAGSVRDSGTLQAGIIHDWDFFGRHAAELQAALGQQRALEAEQAAAALGLASAVSRSYVALAHLLAQQALIDEQLQLRQRSLELQRERAAAGLDDKQALRQAEAPLDELRRQREALGAQVQAQRHALAALSAQPVQALAALAPKLPELLSWQQAPQADLLGRRPDIIAARWRVEASVQDVRVARAQFYPNVTLSAFVGLDAIGLDQLFKQGSYQAGFSPSVRLPLFDTGRLRAQLRGSAAAQDAAVAAYNATLFDALRDATDQFSALQSLQAQRRHQAQLLANAEAQQALVRQRVDAGLSGQLPWLASRQQQLQQQRQALELKAQALDAQLRLIQALGGGQSEGSALAAAGLTAPAAPTTSH